MNLSTEELPVAAVILLAVALVVALILTGHWPPGR